MIGQQASWPRRTPRQPRAKRYLVWKSASCRCEYFKVGYNTSGTNGTLDQVVFADEFTASSPGLSVTLQYDAAGNLTDDGLDDDGPYHGLYTYVYDAWNRLVEVKRKVVSGTAPTIATYRYDGLGRRIYKKVEHSGDRDRTESFYYAGWQLLEVRNGSDVALRQFVWGTQYIDEAICMNVDTDADGNCIDSGASVRYLYMQDANWNVVRVWSDNVWTGTSTERYDYDPYGVTRVLAGYNSGEGHEDLNVVAASQLAASNPIRFAGYYFDEETGLYHVRHRMYSPSLQRWIQRDPAESADGMNLYQYVQSRPVSAKDPRGQCTIYYSCTLTGSALNGCYRNCMYTCTETHRDDNTAGSNVLCDDPVVPPRGTPIPVGTHETDWYCVLLGILPANCGYLVHTPNPPLCATSFTTNKRVMYQPWSKRNCSLSACRKAFQDGGDGCRAFCDTLSPPFDWFCKGGCEMGQELYVGFCESYCQQP